MTKEDVQVATREEQWHHKMDHVVACGVLDAISMEMRRLIHGATDVRVDSALWWAVDDSAQEVLA